jgi:two-component system, OmpR family, response regulator
MDRFKVIVIDDEVDFVDTMVKRLKDKGLESYGAMNGPEGLELVESKDPDVVVLDVKMPKMSGIEVLREIKKRKPLTEVIMLTGHGSVEAGIQGLQLGAYNYVMKPVPFNELLNLIVQAYDRKLIEQERGV